MRQPIKDPAAYLDAVKATALEEVRNAPQGGRNAALNRAAYTLFSAHRGLLEAGASLHMSEDDLSGELRHAGFLNGLQSSEIRSTLQSARRNASPLPLEVSPHHASPGTRHPQHSPRNKSTDAKKLPPSNQVQDVWSMCAPVEAGGPAAVVFRRWEGLATTMLKRAGEVDFCRVLPSGDLPGWCGGWRQGYRLVFPCWGADGELVTLRARWTGQGKAPRGKCDAGRGVKAGPAVLACAVGQSVLQGAPLGWSGVVVICEGESDLMAWSLAADAEGDRCAVLGIWSGSWSPAFAERLRDGSKVVLATDADQQGDKYALEIAETFRSLGMEDRIFRWHSELDAADLLSSGVDPHTTLEARCEPFRAVLVPPKERAVVRDLESYRMEAVEWLWEGWLPRGKLVLVAGDASVGKSTLVVDWLARVTRGEAFPGAEASAQPCNVLIVASEDAIGDTVRPRCRAAGAASGSVQILVGMENGRPWTVADLPALKHEIAVYRAAVVLIEPLTAFMGTADAHSNQQVKQALVPLQRLAEETGCTILVIEHFRKSEASQGMHMVNGSVALTSTPRSVILVTRDPNDRERRLVYQAKVNNAVTPKPFSFRIEGVEVPREDDGALISSSRVVYDDEPVTESFEQAHYTTSTQPGSPEQARVITLILPLLKEAGEAGVRRQDIVDHVTRHGGSEATTKRALKALQKSGVARSESGRWLIGSDGGEP